MEGRCTWPSGDLMVAYHDEEWGLPSRDPKYLFEFLILEGAQAGLSWSTVLNRRETYRAAFSGFDPAVIAQYGPDDVERLMVDPGIVRNRAKVLATIANAQAWLGLDDPVGFIWSFVNDRPIVNRPAGMGDIPAVTDEAVSLSKALKKKGFGFVGPTIMYAFMQATGMVNDHLVTCPRWLECQSDRK